MLKCWLSSDLRREEAGSFVNSEAGLLCLATPPLTTRTRTTRTPIGLSILYVFLFWTWSVKGLLKRTFRPQLQGCHLLAYRSMVCWPTQVRFASLHSCRRIPCLSLLCIVYYKFSYQVLYIPFNDADHLIEYEQSYARPFGHSIYPSIHPSTYLWLQAVVPAIEL